MFAKSSFNSTLVRLKVRMKMQEKATLFGFNSTLVRLIPI